MHFNDIIRDERVLRIRELKDENARLKAEIARLSAVNAAMEKHVALAVLSARDAAMLPKDGSIVILDGWNIILGARPKSIAGSVDFNAPRIRDRDALMSEAIQYADAHQDTFVWIVYDGAEESAAMSAPRVRISYTGGEGSQRADRLIIDFLRMLSLSGQAVHAILVTADRDLGRAAEKLKAKVIPPYEFFDLR